MKKSFYKRKRFTLRLDADIDERMMNLGLIQRAGSITNFFNGIVEFCCDIYEGKETDLPIYLDNKIKFRRRKYKVISRKSKTTRKP